MGSHIEPLIHFILTNFQKFKQKINSVKIGKFFAFFWVSASVFKNIYQAVFCSNSALNQGLGAPICSLALLNPVVGYS